MMGDALQFIRNPGSLNEGGVGDHLARCPDAGLDLLLRIAPGMLEKRMPELVIGSDPALQ
ncbi:hypothetical protein D3C73_1663830 [compost metagenome]